MTDPEAPVQELDPSLGELEFMRLLPHLLPFALQETLSDFQLEVRIGQRFRVDALTFAEDGTPIIVEAKVVTPQTSRRLRDARYQLEMYREAYIAEHPGSRPRLVLAVTSALHPQYKNELRQAAVEVVDGPTLAEAAQRAGIDLPIIGVRKRERLSPRGLHRADELSRDLSALPCGRGTWSPYQRLLRDILAYLFCPPLEQPIYELPNATGINRRDIILPNYADSGFWAFMRSHYDAHYLVVDAKNYCREVKKNDVLQMANYLSLHGAGLTGFVVTRRGSANAAEVTSREQWAFHRKLVLVFNDDDLHQMLTGRKAGDAPDALVRQKVEDFRLSF